MEWTQALTIIGSNIAILLWARREAMQDWRLSEAKIEAYRSDTDRVINEIRKEMREFHTKLCILQDRQNDNR